MTTSRDVLACLRPYLREHKESDLIQILSSVSQDQREHIVRCWLKPEKQTVFFRACWTQPVTVIDYLIKNCRPNMNDRCPFYDYDHTEPLTINDATPLFLAAHEGKTDLTKLLIENGADLNAKSRSGISPLHAACLKDNVEIVKLLGDAGADVNTSDNDGSTCLMATDNEEIITYLINQGINVNARQTTGAKATALHNATKFKAEALVEAGADMSIPDKNGHHPFLTAAFGTRGDVMYYLLETNHESASTVFKACVLCAVSLILEEDGTGLETLELLYKLYQQKPEEGIVCEHPEQMEYIAQWFPDINVPQTGNELLQMLDDGHSMLSVALLIASQYISIECEFFICGLLKHAENIMDQDRNKSLTICSFVYDSILNRKDWFHEYVGDCVSQYVRVLGKICLEQRPVSHDLKTEFDSLTSKLAAHIVICSKERKIVDNEDDEAGSILTKLMIALLYMVNIGIKCHLEDTNFHSELRRLAHVNPQNIDGKSLLHIPVDKSTLFYDDPIKLQAVNPDLDLDVVSCLVHQGFPMDTQDHQGITPLMFLLSWGKSATSQAQRIEDIRKSEVIGRFLLEKGAHADVQSEYPDDDVPVLEDFEIPPMKYLTLKCLAANAFVKQNIPYRDEMLPRELKSFIDLHVPYNHYQKEVLHESLD